MSALDAGPAATAITTALTGSGITGDIPLVAAAGLGVGFAMWAIRRLYAFAKGVGKG